MRKILLAKPKIGFREQVGVVKVLRSGKIAQGPKVLEFEEKFSKIVGGRDCIAVNSGTSASLLSLIALGIGPGDEVIVPSFTFAATANSVALTGAKPVFVDIDSRTFNLSLQGIQDAISTRTKAIHVVHLYGLPANMAEIARLAKANNLLIIEDAAQAHLAAIGDKLVGTFGNAAAFSFYPTKNMTTGEGGMVVVSDPVVARKIRMLRNQGMEQRYQNELIGYNMRMTDISATIGIFQLAKLEEWTEKRIKNAEYLSNNIIGSIIPTVPDDFKHVYHQYTVRIESNRDSVAQALQIDGIETGVYYPTPVHQLRSFSSDIHLPNTEKSCREVLSIPVHPRLTKRDLIKVVGQLNRRVEENKR